MKGECEEALGQGGRVNRVCRVCRLIFYALLCRARPQIGAANHSFLSQRELFAPGLLLSLPVNRHQTSELFYDLSQRQLIAHRPTATDFCFPSQ